MQLLEIGQPVAVGIGIVGACRPRRRHSRSRLEAQSGRRSHQHEERSRRRDQQATHGRCSRRNERGARGSRCVITSSSAEDARAEQSPMQAWSEEPASRAEHAPVARFPAPAVSKMRQISAQVLKAGGSTAVRWPRQRSDANGHFPAFSGNGRFFHETHSHHSCHRISLPHAGDVRSSPRTAAASRGARPSHRELTPRDRAQGQRALASRRLREFHRDHHLHRARAEAESLQRDRRRPVRRYAHRLHRRPDRSFLSRSSTPRTNRWRSSRTGVPSYPHDGPAVQQWLLDLYSPGQLINTSELLNRLNTRIYEAFRYVARYDPGVQLPCQTLALGTGSCRDYAVFMMEAARHWGFASRFVTGYIQMAEGQHGATHAWTEIYIPGAGWRGFDPTNNKLAGTEHIAVARGPRPGQGIPALRLLGRTARRLGSNGSLRTGRGALTSPLPWSCVGPAADLAGCGLAGMMEIPGGNPTDVASLTWSTYGPALDGCRPGATFFAFFSRFVSYLSAFPTDFPRIVHACNDCCLDWAFVDAVAREQEGSAITRDWRRATADAWKSRKFLIFPGNGPLVGGLRSTPVFFRNSGRFSQVCGQDHS